MKYIFGFLLIITFVLLGFYFFWKFYDNIEKQKEKANNYKLSNEELNQIKDGDIILRRGYGMVSDYIVDTFNEEFKVSHCGIICMNENNMSVIHSESSSYFKFEGIQKQNFEEFIKASYPQSVLIVRFNKCEHSDLSKISKRAKYYLSKKISFDYDFNIKDSSEMYCAEIIWHIFLDEFNQDIYQFNNKVKYNQFANFWNKTYFDVIINHQKYHQ